jgi:hypothetical protein
VHLTGATSRRRWGSSRAAGTGLRQLLRNPVVLRIAVASTVLYLAVDMTLVADVPLARSFGWGAVGYGLMDAFWGGGALLGAVLASRVVARAESPAMVGGTAAIALGFAAVAASAATFVLGSALRQARLATYRMPVAWIRPASIAACSSASLVSARSEKR